MKRVLSVSLGSAEGDFEVHTKLLGQAIELRRVGTNGNIKRYVELLREYDGKVDAFGFGGSDMYLWSGGRRYAWRESMKIAANATQTPVLDGSGLKNTLERETIRYLAREGVIDFAHLRTLLVCAVDRFGMAEALVEQGGPVIFGDLMFALGLPIPIRNHRVIQAAARVLLPLLVRLPIAWVYPTGSKQSEIVPKFHKYYAWADTICGDGHYLRRHMPERLDGKAIVTNTTTPAHVEQFRWRGVRLLVTTTPAFGGRSPGTNVLEAAIVAVLERPPEKIGPEDYMQALREMGWKPNIVTLQGECSATEKH